jgi:uncharacterized protein
MNSYFPDINVWVALAYGGHQHHTIAASWFNQLAGNTVGFCRVTQIGFLRLLTSPAVMRSEVKTQLEAWMTYDGLADDPRVTFYPEPDAAIEDEFRRLTMSGRFSPQQWPDAYLAAFAKSCNLILVTFDRALIKLAGKYALLLR